MLSLAAASKKLGTLDSTISLILNSYASFKLKHVCACTYSMTIRVAIHTIVDVVGKSGVLVTYDRRTHTYVFEWCSSLNELWAERISMCEVIDAYVVEERYEPAFVPAFNSAFNRSGRRKVGTTKLTMQLNANDSDLVFKHCDMLYAEFNIRKAAILCGWFAYNRTNTCVALPTYEASKIPRLAITLSHFVSDLKHPTHIMNYDANA